MAENPGFHVSLELLQDYMFKIDFEEYGNLITDEAPPLGKGDGPNPMRLVAAAVGNCLCASLLFSLNKKKQPAPAITADVHGELTRIDGRWRIAFLRVDMKIDEIAVPREVLQDSLAQFEDFCIVTQSIRSGIPVQLEVRDAEGELLMSSR